MIIRAHGVVPQVVDRAERLGLTVLDATCPYVKKVHMAAEKLVREGYQLIVVGESGHPEVEGIMGHADERARVVSSPADLDAIELSRKVGVVVQTTQTVGTLSSIVSALLSRTAELRVINTICAATQERQDSAAELAARVDVMHRRGREELRQHAPTCPDLPDGLRPYASYRGRLRARGLLVRRRRAHRRHRRRLDAGRAHRPRRLEKIRALTEAR